MTSASSKQPMGLIDTGELFESDHPLDTWRIFRSSVNDYKMANIESELPQDLPVIEGDAADDNNEEGGINYERHHAKLLDAISSLDGVKRVRHTLRTVPGKGVSEFDFKSGRTAGNKQLLSELVGSLDQSASHGSLKRQLKVTTKHSKVLPVPLPKHEKEKIQRTIGYEKAVKEVSKWTSAVIDNRKARQLIFPLHRPNTKLVNDHIKFKPITPFEKEIAEALKQRNPDHIIHEGKVFTPAEEKELAGMTLEEAKARRSELLRYRSMIYNKESKLRWQNKIKSKRYRRALKKEKLKKEQKELEELQRTDPEAFLEKLEQLDKDRIRERTNLRHRGGSKFAKKQMIYAKFDDQKRQAVQDMIQKSKELTKKLHADEESDGEDTTGNLGFTEQGEATNNPWMQIPTTKLPEFSRPQALQNIITDINIESEDEEETKDEIESLFSNEKMQEEDSEVSRELKGQAKPMDSSHNGTKDVLKCGKSNKEDKKGGKAKQVKKKDAAFEDKKEKLKKASNESFSEKPLKEVAFEALQQVQHDESLIDIGLDRKTTLEQLESETGDMSSIFAHSNKQLSSDVTVLAGSADDKSVRKSNEEYVDPNVLLSLKSKPVGKQTAEVVMEGEDNIDDAEDAGRMTIMEAFEEDDVVAEFLEAKTQTVEDEKAKDIDLTLPGWGEWGGPGLQPSKKKRERFTIKAKEEKREDSSLGNVIISKKQNTAVLKHLVQKVPYPFKNAEEYVASLKTPVGREWNTENAFKTLTKPKVVTKLGAVIDPLDSSVLLKPMKRKAEGDIDLHTKKSFKKNKNKKQKK